MSFGQRPKLIRMGAGVKELLDAILRPRGGRSKGMISSWHAGRHRGGRYGCDSSGSSNQRMRVSRHAAINRRPLEGRYIEPHPMRSNGNRAGMRRSFV